MKFENLKYVNGLLSNNKQNTKDVKYTLVDLLRTPKIYLSYENSLKNALTRSWGDDYKLFDLSRYYLGMERSNKTKEFKYPDDKTVFSQIFPFFSGDKLIEDYIQKNANQHNFLNAARTEVKLRMLADGFSIQSGSESKNTFEFKKQSDGSYIFIESFSLPKTITNSITDEEYTSQQDSIAFVSMKTKVKVIGGQIIHEIQDFSFEPQDFDICVILLKGDEFSVFKEYMSKESLSVIEKDIEDDYEIIEVDQIDNMKNEDKKHVKFNDKVQNCEIPDFSGDEIIARKTRLMIPAFNAELKNPKMNQDRFDEAWDKTFNKITEKELNNQQEKFDNSVKSLKKCKH